MAVNTSIYGTPDTWVYTYTLSSTNTIAQTSLPKICTYPNNTHNLSGAVAAEIFNINTPIDNSIAFVGVDDYCEMVNTQWVRPPRPEQYTLTDDSGTTQIELDGSAMNVVCEMRKNTTNPLAFFTSSSQSTTQYNSEMRYCGNGTQYKNCFWGYGQDDTINQIPDRVLQAVTQIPIQDMVWVILVKAYSGSPETESYTNQGTVNTYDLWTYCNGEESGIKIYTKYPYIINISLLPVYRNKTEIPADPESPPKTILRNAFNSSDRRSPLAAIMNDFRTGINPFITTEDTPLKILTYYQSNTQSGGDGSFNVLEILSKPDSDKINKFTITHLPILIRGRRNILASLSIASTNNYMFLLSTNCKHRFLKENNIIRWWMWSDYVTADTIDDFYTYCLSQAAYFGGYFTDSFDAAQYTTTWDVPHTYIGTIDDEGVTHGDYTEGAENRKQKQWEWDDYGKNNYNPNAKPIAPDTEQPSDPTKLFGGNLNGLTTGRYYALTDNEVLNLKKWCDDIVNPAGPFSQTEKDGYYTYEDLAFNLSKAFQGGYPEDCILSLQWFPFSLPDKVGSYASSQPIQLGTSTTSSVANWFGSSITGVTATKLSGQQYAVMTSNVVEMEEYFGDFRDYQPYTTMEIYVPWHGTLPIDPSVWYGHTLQVMMVVDLITGASTSYVLRDPVGDADMGQIVASVDGQVGATVNYNVRNVGQYSQTLMQAQQQANDQRYNNARTYLGAAVQSTAALVTIGGAVMTGNIPAALMGGAALGGQIINTVQAETQQKNKDFAVGHVPSGATQVSSQSPSVSHFVNDDVRLIIKRPHLLPGYNAAKYGASVGYACNITGQVGGFKGYTVFSGADLDGLTATETEKQLIYAQLQSGVII